MSAAASLDLPIPASPDSSTTWPSPVLAFAQRRSKKMARWLHLGAEGSAGLKGFDQPVVPFDE